MEGVILQQQTSILSSGFFFLITRNKFNLCIWYNSGKTGTQLIIKNTLRKSASNRSARAKFVLDINMLVLVQVMVKTEPEVVVNNDATRLRGSDVIQSWEITLKRRCKPCKGEEHFHWNHFKAKGMCFCKVMDSGFSQGLVIPEKCVKNFKGKLPGTLNLRSPSGNLWSVRLLNFPWALFIKDGWKVFVDAHYVEEDDVLGYESCILI